MDNKKFIYFVPEEYDGKEAKNFLRQNCRLTSSVIKLLKNTENGITRNGDLLRTIDKVHTGDKIILTLPPDKNHITPVKGELDILYEDEYILVVNKPYNMPVHPTKIHQNDTLANIVSYYQNIKNEKYTFRSIFRLDKDTTGCVVIVKDLITYSLMKNSITKTYLAVCEGEILKPGTINKPICLADGSKMRRVVSEKGVYAITHYQPISSCNNHTMLKIHLETGRTHQIRCHLSSVGHPLAGDSLYGGHKEFIEHQALHCKSVEFIHPITKEIILIEAETPKEYNNMLL